MYRNKVKIGIPYVFQEFAFFSPKQFDEPVVLEDKDMLFKLKICTNSNRAFTGPFFMECMSEHEVTPKELKQMLNMVNDTPGLIICGEEYTITDTNNALWQYYGPVVQRQRQAT